MDRFTPTDRRRAGQILLIAAIAVAAAGSAAGTRWYVPAGRALYYGICGVFFINIALFSVNALSSASEWKHSRTEEELGERAIPALRGELNAIGPRLVRISTMLLAACLGIIAGAILALLIPFALQLVRA